MVERLARRRNGRGQFAFASEAKALIPPRPEYLLAQSHRGLHLLGRNEQSLRVPVGVLRCTYGTDVVIEPHPAREAVMEVRVELHRRDLQKVRAALTRRGVNPSEEYNGAYYCVLRFEAPIDDLLGLPLELAQLTSGQANHHIVLRRDQ
jgi:hypothetical protein